MTSVTCTWKTQGLEMPRVIGRETTHTLGLPQRKSPDCVSPEFLLIVEQLLAQHVSEVEGKSNRFDLLHQLAGLPPPSLPTPARGSLHRAKVKRVTIGATIDEAEDEGSPCKESQEQVHGQGQKGGSITNGFQRLRSTGSGSTVSGQILCKQHETAPHLDAGKIVQFLDDNAEELKEMEGDFHDKLRIDLDALPGLLSDTPTAKAMRPSMFGEWRQNWKCYLNMC